MVVTSAPRARIDHGRMVRRFAPVVLLTATLTLIALLIHGPLSESPRLGTDLVGGRLLAVADLGRTWADYLASWHPIAGGTSSPAPPALLVLALLGTVLAPVGGPPLVVAVVLLGGLPLAGLTAYVASRALPAARGARAFAAGAYALVPVAALSAAQGRLDVVVAHIVLPPLLVGLCRVLGLAPTTSWFRSACLTTLGLAVLGAFAPLLHVVLVLLVSLGFCVLPSRRWTGSGRQRIAALATVVVLPVMCLLPWPIVLLSEPGILLHGIGARVTETSAGPWLLTLSPDDTPGGWLGGVLVLTTAVAVVRKPTRGMLPGLAVALSGGIAAVLVDTLVAVPVSGGPATTGWAGGPLVLVAAGLMWTLLAGDRPGWATPPILLAVLAILATGTVFAGKSGPLRTEQPTPVTGPLLVVENGPFPARLVTGPPRFGVDDLVPTDAARQWLERVDADLFSGDRERVRGAIASAAARGVRTVAIPPGSTVADHAGDVVAESGRLAGGRHLLRVRLPHSPVELLGPDLARQARTGTPPSTYERPIPVPGTLPHFAVRVSEGGPGRVLVLDAENQAGWSAWINGQPAPLASAWGSQVAVPLPEEASEVRVSYTELPRMMQLGVQVIAILYGAIGALPLRRKRWAAKPSAPPEPARPDV